MKKWIAISLLLLLGTGCQGEDPTSSSNEATADVSENTHAETTHGWLTDFAEAQKQSTEKNLPILINFSGSDWCGWCIKLDNEVFSKDEFKAYAKDNLILFLADFPNQKEQPNDVKAQNEALSKTYKVTGFPTILLLDSKGDVIAKTGYQRGGPTAYVEHLKTLLK